VYYIASKRWLKGSLEADSQNQSSLIAQNMFSRKQNLEKEHYGALCTTPAFK
jgi:hypothetical protein